jgi:hypothetical protein
MYGSVLYEEGSEWYRMFSVERHKCPHGYKARCRCTVVSFMKRFQNDIRMFSVESHKCPHGTKYRSSVLGYGERHRRSSSEHRWLTGRKSSFERHEWPHEDERWMIVWFPKGLTSQLKHIKDFMEKVDGWDMLSRLCDRNRRSSVES